MPSVSGPIFQNGILTSTGCQSWRQWPATKSAKLARRLIGGRTPGRVGGALSFRGGPVGGRTRALRIAPHEEGVELPAHVDELLRKARPRSADELWHSLGIADVARRCADVFGGETRRRVEVGEAAVGARLGVARDVREREAARQTADDDVGL